MTMRPVLPLINYAVNYDYIVENLCENKAKPELMCNGKCYVSKELTKTNQEQTTQNGHKISVPSIDAFLVAEDFKFTHSDIDSVHQESISTFCTDPYHSEYHSKIFRPPSV
ncbi:hypothetical protein [Chryseobacterium indoltheticum]|mgnify:CR=1 FL=1|jgi:hypothetical protein|uniref:hypothetical protein n=1 Tax=Chryseobacterium indoltheticum TaxID=254 RepID=UPI0028EC11E0|nr:hypothetical protein [Chryseobacterium indoltheticum]